MKRKKKAEHKRELKKKEEKGKVDKKKAEAELNATLSNLTLPPKSTDPWDVDPGGLPAPGGGPELVVVHRSNLAYVGVEFQETKARAGKTAQSWSLKSGAVWKSTRRGGQRGDSGRTRRKFDFHTGRERPRTWRPY